MHNLRIAFVLMETIYPYRGGVHEGVYLLLREIRKLGINAEIVAYSRRRVDENGRRLLWLRSLSPHFIKKLSNYDVLIGETAWIVLPTLMVNRSFGKKCIMHLHSVESIQDTGLNTIGKIIVKYLEKLSLMCDAVLVPSKVEYELLSKRTKRNNVYILPNFIDFNSFITSKPAPLKKPAVVFVGGMGYPPNREAAYTIIKISKLVNSSGRKVNFYLVGPSPPPVSPPVYATGYVESTAPYILGADICIAPIYRGGGVKLKMLEYMASGKPIIATKKAAEGIDDIVYVEAEKPEEFAEAIIAILKGKINMDFGKNINVIKRNHTPNKAAEKLIKIINGVING